MNRIEDTTEIDVANNMLATGAWELVGFYAVQDPALPVASQIPHFVLQVKL